MFTGRPLKSKVRELGCEAGGTPLCQAKRSKTPQCRAKRDPPVSSESRPPCVERSETIVTKLMNRLYNITIPLDHTPIVCNIIPSVTIPLTLCTPRFALSCELGLYSSVRRWAHLPVWADVQEQIQ